MTPILAPVAAVGRSTLGLLAAIGRVAIFAGRAVSHPAAPALLPARTGAPDPCTSAGCRCLWWASPRCSPAVRWRCRSYAGGSRFDAQAVVPQIVAIGIVARAWPGAGRADGRGTGGRRHRRRDRHHEGDGTDRRACDPLHQPAEISRRSAHPCSDAQPAGAGRGGRCHRPSSAAISSPPPGSASTRRRTFATPSSSSEPWM